MIEHIKYQNSIIEYEIQGSGPVLVMLHGFLETKSMWSEISETFENKIRFISIDLPGHGGSEPLLSQDVSIGDFADACLSVLHKNSVSEYHLFGHSMGAYVALEMLRKKPNNTLSICLFHSTALSDTHEKKINRDRAVAIVEKDKTIFRRNTLKTLFKDSVSAEKEIDSILLRNKNMSKKGIAQCILAMKNRNSNSDLLKTSKCDVYYYVGVHDKVLPLKGMEEEIKKIRPDVIYYDKKSAHMGHIENNQELLLFVKDLYS